MVIKSEYYQEKADELHEREREIKAARGKIIDNTGEIIATNKTVCTISVIHSQINDPEKVIEVLCKELGLTEEIVRKRVEKYSSIERVKTNVDKETGDKIRSYALAGVKVDEDFKRYYPYGSLASKVLGFTGSDNQGIIGLEVKYEDYLKGQNGYILTMTDARGVEIEDVGEGRIEPIAGNDLYISLDSNIQKFAEQSATKVMKAKSADSVSIIVMNPKNGEIMAMVNLPEFDLNDPFTLNTEVAEDLDDKTKQNLLNQMWRNRCINDTYEPGSTFKVITAAAGLEEGVVTLEDTFTCPGYKIVEDRRITDSYTHHRAHET
jgi:stage V sporulation protein D (sporulation-specific penicillin-binding protein)